MENLLNDIMDVSLMCYNHNIYRNVCAMNEHKINVLKLRQHHRLEVQDKVGKSS